MRRLSSTVIRGNSRRFSGTCAIPNSRMRCAAVLTKSTPSKLTLPRIGRIKPEINRIKVVLPAPFGPMTATASPRRTCSETSNKAWKVP